MNGKISRRIKIGFAIGMVALTMLACGSGDDVGNKTYEAIQNGQNAIKEAGAEVKEFVDDSDILSAPTGVEQDTGGLIPALEDLINDNCD